MTTTCPDCQYQYIPAKSRRLTTCPSCAHKAKHGYSLQDKTRRKAKAAMERSRIKSREKQKLNPKPKTPLPKFSEKGAKRDRKIAATKTKLKTDALEGGFVQCSGCLNYFDVIDASHIVPVSQSSALASNPKIMSLLCRGCHTAFENGTVPEMIELKCFVRDMTTMFEFDNSRFWNIFYRLRDEWVLRPTPKLSAVLDKLERLETQ